jgi:nucleotide-binding universal stress UspA family protein
MRFLICTDGSAIGEQAVKFGAALVRASAAEATLLGVAPSADGAAQLRVALGRLQTLFPKPVEVKLKTGRPAIEYLAETGQVQYDLMVVGSRGRRGWERLAFGSVAARLARYARIPVLIVKGPPRPAVRKVLACTGGNVQGERAARWGGRIARWLGAEVTVLHVMSQMAISPEANLDELTETAEKAVARGTREGKHLAREIELLRGRSGAAPLGAQPKLRHGLVLEEIVAEVEEGDYDLVVIGGHQAPEFPGWGKLKEYLLEDVADQIISAMDRPVLVVKGQ